METVYINDVSFKCESFETIIRKPKIRLRAQSGGPPVISEDASSAISEYIISMSKVDDETLKGWRSSSGNTIVYKDYRLTHMMLLKDYQGRYVFIK